MKKEESFEILNICLNYKEHRNSNRIRNDLKVVLKPQLKSIRTSKGSLVYGKW